MLLKYFYSIKHHARRKYDVQKYKRLINDCLFAVIIILISSKDYGKLGSNVVINDDTFENAKVTTM